MFLDLGILMFCYVMSCLLYIHMLTQEKICISPQIEQEMALIIGHDVKSSFISNWKSFVPAVLLYGETSRKASIHGHMKDVDETGIPFLLK